MAFSCVSTRPSGFLTGRPASPALVSRKTAPVASRSRVCMVKAGAQPDSESLPTQMVQKVAQIWDRYDFVSAGIGALCVTTLCVARGQDPMTALSITAASTVVALLLNDTLFNDS